MVTAPRPISKALSLGLATGFVLVSIVVLHQLGARFDWMVIPHDDLSGWLALAPLEDVVAAVLRTMALAVAYWIGGTSAIYAVARLTRVPALIRATAWSTVPSIRRAIDRAIAVTLTSAALTSGALTSAALTSGALASPIHPAFGAEPTTTEPVIYQISDQGVPVPVSPPLVDPTFIAPPGAVGAGYTPHPAGGIEIADPTGGAAETNYEVVEGDNLWTISASHLERALPDVPITAQEIGPYWRKVIELNTDSLRSGDPNLIFPGEVIQLPEIQGGQER